MNLLTKLAFKSPAWAVMAAGACTINLTPSLALADDEAPKVTFTAKVSSEDNDKTPAAGQSQVIIVKKTDSDKEDADDDDDKDAGNKDKGDGNQKKVIIRRVHPKVVTTESDADGKKRIFVREIDPTKSMHANKKIVTWLGVAVGDLTEALTSQLGLKPGEGLLVSQVSPESPAAKAELKNNDVLVEFDGQMLVDATQLRKLVQMHPEGDEVKVVFLRGGKKQSVNAKLGKTVWEEASVDEDSLHGNMHAFQFDLGSLNALHDGLANMTVSLKNSDLDKQHLDLEVKQTMEQTRKAIQDAMRHARSGSKNLSGVYKELDALASSGVDVDKDATVVVRNAHNSVKTIVKTDDGGSYIIIADPTRHLIVHDKHGKTLFDGLIETEEQQQKVPGEVWEKVKPMLEQVESPKADEPESKKDKADKQ